MKCKTCGHEIYWSNSGNWIHKREIIADGGNMCFIQDLSLKWRIIVCGCLKPMPVLESEKK